MRKFFISLSLLIFLLFSFKSGFSQTFAGITSIGSASACPGTIVTIPVNLYHSPPIAGLSLTIYYDASVLSALQTGNTSYFVMNPNNVMQPLTTWGYAQTNKTGYPGLKQVKIAWNDSAALQLDTNSSGVAHLFDLLFRYFGSTTALTFDNSAQSGGNCEYDDSNGNPYIDTPTSIYYINGSAGLGPAPPQPGSITGPVNPVPGYNLYSVPNTPGVTYNWSNNCNFSGTSTANSITYFVSSSSRAGIISVSATYVCGASPPSTLQITGYSASGIFRYDDANLTPCDSALIYIRSNGGIFDSTRADLNGNYIFNNLLNGSYHLTAYPKPWGGVNSTDEVKISRHISGSEPFRSSLRLHAADVDMSYIIDATDQLKIRRRFAGTDNSFARGNWVFEKPTGGDTINVSTYLNDSVIVYNNNVTQDFLGRCVGDEHPNVSSFPAGITSVGSDTSCAGNVIIIPVNLSGVTYVSGFSLSLNYDASVLSAIQAGNNSNFIINPNNSLIPLSSWGYAQTTKTAGVKQLKMIWNSSSAVQLDTNSGGIAHLCDIRFRYLGGSTSLSFDNSSFNGKNCEYSDNIGDPMIDTPTINHYICGYITHYPYPSQPGAISGPLVPNQSPSVYSVVQDSGLTYQWSTSCHFYGTSSTNSISYFFYGNSQPCIISVIGTNCGGNSPARTLAIIPAPGDTVSGFVRYEGYNICVFDSVYMFLKQNGITIDSCLALYQDSLYYHFDHVESGVFNITGFINNAWGGVNSTDAVKVNRHFTGSEPLTTSLQLHAADVNNSDYINATDAVNIVRRFVGADTNFVRNDQIFEKPQGGDTLTVSPTLNDTIIVNGTNLSQNFAVIFTGDVNASYPSSLGGSWYGSVNGSGIYNISNVIQGITSIGSATACPGAIISVPVTLSGSTAISALSLTIDYDATVLSAIQTGNNSNFIINQNNVLTPLVTISRAQTDKPGYSGVKQVKIAWNTCYWAVQLDTNSSGVAHLFDIKFRYLGGTTSLTFDNSANLGGNCEYADNNGYPLIDTPTTIYYVNGTVSQGNAPVVPGPISGNSMPCQGNNSYSIINVPGITYYWSNTCGFSDTSSASTISYTFNVPVAPCIISITGSNGCGTSSASSIEISAVLALSTNPTSASATLANVCFPISDSLSVTAGSLGDNANWNWYSGSCGGTFEGSGSPLAVIPTVTIVYYVRAEGTCNTTSCLSITIVLDSLSILPDSATVSPTVICPGNSVTMGISGGSLGTGANWFWYSASCGGTMEGNNGSIIVSPVQTTLFFVRAEGNCNTTLCCSLTVTVDIYSSPADSIDATLSSICPGNSSTLIINGGLLGTGAIWTWYTDSCSGSFIGTGGSLMVNPSISTSYYARAEGICNTTSCASKTIDLYINSAQADSIIATSSTICSGNSITLGISGGVAGSGGNWYWYSSSCGGTISGTGILLIVSPSVSTDYFVRAQSLCNSSACVSKTIVIYSLSTPADSIIAGQSTICTGNAVSLGISGGALGSGSEWKWYGSSCGGTYEGSGSIINVSPSNTSTYYLRAEGICNSTTCTTITITVNLLPVITLSSNSPVCYGDSLKLSSNGGSEYLWSGPCGFSSSQQNPEIANFVSCSGYYNVTVTTIFGCIGADSINVSFQPLSSLQGTLLSNGGTLSSVNATIEIFKEYNSIFQFYDSTSYFSNYAFTNLLPGSYILKATINDALHPLILPTYYDSVYLWQNADTITIQCNSIVNKNVKMVEMVSQPGGAGLISGNINYLNGNTKTIGDPVSGAEILLIQEPGDQPIKRSRANISGFYEFLNIPTNFIYRLDVDITGLPQFSTFNIDMTQAIFTYQHMNFIVDTSGSDRGIYIQSGSGISENNLIDFSIIVYPNPFIGKFDIKYNLSKKSYVNIEILDILGSYVATIENGEKEKGEYYCIYNCTNDNELPGVFFLKFIIDKTVFIKKVIQSR